MAITPRDNEAFYREVDEELRREQLQQGWQKYGVYIIGGVILLLAAIGGVIYWQHRQEMQAGERGEQMVAALRDMEAGNRTTAAAKLDGLVADGGEAYKAPALLAKANAALAARDDKAALEALKAVAGDATLAEPFRNLALIKQTTIEFDTLSPDAVIARMKPLAVAGSPWFGTASEMVALAHLKAGRPQQAAPIFAAIARDETAPASMRGRAAQMASAFGIDATGPEDANVRVVKEASE